MRTTLLSLFTIGAIVPALVNAHGRLATPTTRDAAANSPTYMQNAPVLGNSADFICRGFNALANPAVTVEAGQNFTATWIFEAAHPGDCFFYLSYDVTKPATEMIWYKINQIRDCHLISSYSVQIPSWSQAGKAALRFEWYALQQVTNVEFYLQCSDILITRASGAGSGGTPNYTIPGHLPTDAAQYRKVYQPNTPQFFTGPEVATAIDPTGGAGTGTGTGSGSGSGSGTGSGSGSGSGSGTGSGSGSGSGSSSTSSSSNKSSSNAGGIAAGVIVGCAAIGGIAFFVARKHRGGSGMSTDNKAVRI